MKRSRKVELPSLKISPVVTKTVAGPKATVDRRSGHVHLMLTRSGWPAELGEAVLLFERDYQLSRGGIRAQSFEPHVDGSRTADTPAGLPAIARVRKIEAALDGEELAVLTLWGVLGVTISEISKRGWGQKDEIGRVLQRAAAKAASVYLSGYAAPQSKRVIEMNKFIRESTSRY